MFNDERINQESGKIYQRGILIATIVAFIYCGLRIWYLSTIGQFMIKYLFTELFIIVSGIIILLVGVVRFSSNKDERIIFEKHNYYLNAGKIFLVSALSGYALTIPFAFDKTFSDMATNHLILILELIGYIYFFYNFKNKDINFNYSFIAESKGRYFGRVFGNIGKLAGVLGIAFLISAMIDLLLHGSILTLWSIVSAYIISVLRLGIEYLFISFVEKISYDEEDSDKLKKGTFIVGVAIIILSVFLTLLQILYFSVAFSNLQAFPGNVGEVLASISQVRLSANYMSTVLNAMWLCNLMTQMRKSSMVKMSVKGSLAVSIISLFSGVCSSFITACVLNIYDEIEIIKKILTLTNSVSYLILFVSFVFMILFALGAIKDVKAPTMLVLIPIFSGAYMSCSILSGVWRWCAIAAVFLSLAISILWVFIFKSHKFIESI